MDIAAEAITKNCKFCQEEFSYFPSRHGSRKAMTRKRRVRNVCDKCVNDRTRPGRIERHGIEFADYRNEREVEQELARRHTKNYIFGLSMMQPNDFHSISGSQWEQGWPME